MRTFAICMLVGGVVFGAGLGFQLHALPARTPEPTPSDVTPPVEPLAAKKKLQFPADLAPAAQAQPVEEASTFTAGAKPPKVLVVYPSGKQHPFHASFPEDWQATSVESTELVVVISKQRKSLVQKVEYAPQPQGVPPPVWRYQFELDLSVVEPKTGHVLAHRTFRNAPRQIRSVEPWSTTQIGHEVEWGTVYHWLRPLCRLGFPDEHDSQPIVTVIQ